MHIYLLNFVPNCYVPTYLSSKTRKFHTVRPVDSWDEGRQARRTICLGRLGGRSCNVTIPREYCHSLAPLLTQSPCPWALRNFLWCIGHKKRISLKVYLFTYKVLFCTFQEVEFLVFNNFPSS